MKTTAKSGVRAPLEGQAAKAEVIVQADLAERTMRKLQQYFTVDGDSVLMDSEGVRAALAAAFHEAHCDETLYDVFFWDLGGQSRIVSGDTTIPVSALPTVGDILTWANRTYYIGSLRE